MTANPTPSAHWRDLNYRLESADALADEIGQDTLTLIDDDEALVIAITGVLDQFPPQVVQELATLLRQAIDGRGYPALKIAVLRELSVHAADQIQERFCGEIPNKTVSLALAYVSHEIASGALRRVKP